MKYAPTHTHISMPSDPWIREEHAGNPGTPTDRSEGGTRYTEQTINKLKTSTRVCLYNKQAVGRQISRSHQETEKEKGQAFMKKVGVARPTSS